MKIQFRKFNLSLLFLVLSPVAVAADWYVVAESDNYDTAALVDKASVSGPKTARKYWEWTIYRDEPRYSKTLSVVDCNKRERTILEWNSYKDGKIEFSLTPNDKSSLIPDSIAEAVALSVCTGRYRTGPLKNVDVNDIRTALVNANAKTTQGVSK